jgi:hypothetical protein
MNEKIQTGLRLSAKLDERIGEIADDCDLTKNAATKMLIALGIRVYESIKTVPQEGFSLEKSQTSQ